MFLTVLKHNDLFEIVKMGLMYDQSPLGQEYIEMWKVCCQTRFLTGQFESLGESGKEGFKEMLRKVKFLFSLDKGMNFDLGDLENQGDQRQEVEPQYTEL